MQLNEHSLREKVNALKEKLVALEGLVDASGAPVTDGSGQPVQTGTPAAAPAPAAPAPGAATGADMDAATADPAAAAQAGHDAALASGQPDDSAGPTAVAPTAAPAQAAATAGTTEPNYDSMPFGKAFAAARAAGKSQFIWKGKPFNTQSAAAKPAAPANPEAAKIDAEIKRFSSSNNMSLQANKDYVANLQAKKTGAPAATQTPAASPAATTTPAATVMARPTNPMQANVWDQHYGKTNNPDGSPKAVKEGVSVGYSEDQALARIVQLSR